MKVATPRPIGTDLLLVSYLIHGGHWRSDIINANFLEEDRNAILKIRLSRGQRDDNWFWRLDQKGNILLRALINFLLLYHQFLFNMISAPCQDVSVRVSAPVGVCSWSRLQSDWLKININGACFYGYVGIGCIARDSRGHFIGAFQISILGSFEPREVEVMAIQKALAWIKEENWSCVALESDAQTCVPSINDPCYAYGLSFGLIVDDRLQMV